MMRVTMLRGAQEMKKVTALKYRIRFVLLTLPLVRSYSYK